MLTTLISLVAANNLAFQQPAPARTPIKINSIDYPIIQTVPFPIKKAQAIAPIIGAKSVLSIDIATGQILFSQNSEERLPMASLTKLMTAKIALEENPLDQITTITKEATQIDPSKINLNIGEKISVGDLLKAVMIKSANDAAMAIAINNAGSSADFVNKMNQKASIMGMGNTHYQNPVGFDDPKQYSTATDLALLARNIYKNPFIQRVAVIKELEIQSADGKIHHKLETTNELLGSYLKVLGLKTGTTDQAGQCLISIVENSNGNRILTVMLGSNARFKESKILTQWIFDSYQWI